MFYWQMLRRPWAYARNTDFTDFSYGIRATRHFFGAIVLGILVLRFFGPEDLFQVPGLNPDGNGHFLAKLLAENIDVILLLTGSFYVLFFVYPFHLMVVLFSRLQHKTWSDKARATLIPATNFFGLMVLSMSYYVVVMVLMTGEKEALFTFDSDHLCVYLLAELPLFYMILFAPIVFVVTIARSHQISPWLSGALTIVYWAILFGGPFLASGNGSQAGA